MRKNELYRYLKRILKTKNGIYLLAFLTAVNHFEPDATPLKSSNLETSGEKSVMEDFLIDSEEYDSSCDLTTVDVLKIINETMKEESPEEQICEKYNITKEEFDVICAVVLSEAAPGSYEDARAVINTIYNRTQSKEWINYVKWKLKLGDNEEADLYKQVICPGQFEVYSTNAYNKKFMKDGKLCDDARELKGYQAITDFLLEDETEREEHPYTEFRSHNCYVEGAVLLADGGNWYFHPLTNDMRVDKEETRKLVK